MTTPRRRKVWQHDTENISEDQIKECFHRLKWDVDRFGKDYGEDLFVRIFENGAFIGKAFYTQLKGTSDPFQYSLKMGCFSYEVETTNLLQWYRNPFPVIFVLWDIEHRVGYWLHIQPYVGKKLTSDPNWLKNEEGTRNIHIPPGQILHVEEYQSLLALITKEYQKVSLGLQLLGQLQISELDANAHLLIDKFRLAYKPSGNQSLEALPIDEEEERAFSSQEIILPSSPDNAEAWMKLASRYYTQHDYEKAMVAINKAKNLGASGAQYALTHGSILAEYFISKGSTKKSLLYAALELFEAAKEQIDGPGKATSDYNIGNTLSALGNYAKAITHFDAALSVQPPARLAAQIWKNRGTAYFHLSDHKEEFVSYQKALALNPNLWEAYSSWAVTEARLGNYSHAKELYLSALKVYPELAEQHPNQIYGLALAYWKLEELVLAYQYINQALSVKPDNEASLKLKKQILSSLWRKDNKYIPEAITFFRMWLYDNPTDMFARRELYLLYRTQPDTQQARVLLDETTTDSNTDPEDLYHYACMLIAEGRMPEAIDALEKVYQHNQEHAVVHKLAQLKQKTGDYEAAINLYKILFADEELLLLQNVADCYHSLKNYKICAWCCTRAILLEPKKESWWNNLVYSLMALDKVLCAIAVEQLRVRLMAVLLDENSTQSASEFAQKLLEIIRAELGEAFVESIYTSTPPF